MPVQMQVSAVSKSFGDEQVAREVSFAVDTGEVVSILGPSGCGKTTLLRMVAGLEVPEAGEIVIGDQTVYRSRPFAWTPAEARGVGMVFQDFGLWPHLTVRQNVAYALRHGWRGDRRLTRREIDERVAASLATLRIAPLADRRPHQLSGGQQQRVAFARATAARPRLLLLDEPFNALDAQLRAELREELLAALRRDRFTVLHVTHDQEDALALSDRVLVMGRGRVLQYDTPETVYRRPREADVAAFVGRSNLIPVQVEPGPGGRLRLSLPDRRTYTIDPQAGEAPRPGPPTPSMLALIRPEDLELVDRAGRAANARNGPLDPAGTAGDRSDRSGAAAAQLELTGTVGGSQFLGDRYAVRVTVAGVGPLLCYASRKIADGVPVTLRASPGCVHLMPAGDASCPAAATQAPGKAGIP